MVDLVLFTGCVVAVVLLLTEVVLSVTDCVVVVVALLLRTVSVSITCCVVAVVVLLLNKDKAVSVLCLSVSVTRSDVVMATDSFVIRVTPSFEPLVAREAEVLAVMEDVEGMMRGDVGLPPRTCVVLPTSDFIV